MAALLPLPCGAVAPEVSRAQDSMIRCVLGSRVQQVPAFDVGSIQRLGSLARGVAKGIQRNLSTEAWAQRLSAASGVSRAEQGGDAEGDLTGKYRRTTLVVSWNRRN